MHVVQHGFRPCSEYSAQGLDGAMRLANCVNLADQLRMHLAIQQTNTGAGTNSAGSSSSACVLEGQLLVCKVHLGGALQEAEGKVQLSAKAGEQQLNTGSMQTFTFTGLDLVPKMYCERTNIAGDSLLC
jgi:hypothetical protein